MVKKNSSNSTNGTNPVLVQDVTQSSNTGTSNQSGSKRSYLPQTDVPAYSLNEALRIPNTIGDNYAYQPTQPLDVAAALGLQPASSNFRMLVGASSAYGLTDGSYSATYISVTPLALKILESHEESDSIQASRQAFLRPRVIREFLNKYDRYKFPRDDIAKNELSKLGVPNDALDRTLKLIVEGVRQFGLLKDINGVIYVNLQSTTPPRGNQVSTADVEAQDTDSFVFPPEEADAFQNQYTANGTNKQPTQSLVNRRVFITHGKNKSFIDPVKRLLAFGEFEPVVSVERESVSQPVPDKVMNDMRSCSAAIIHIEDEQKLIDSEGNPQNTLNPNVLIEIGAAMALYGRRFILLVKSGVKLPSNLQGLYEVRYEGDKLDGDVTIGLLQAITDIKNHPVPSVSA